VSKPAPEAPVAVGGQAVVEGVMMRAPAATSVAVRRPDGSIIVRVRSAKRVAQALPLLGKPGLRGVAVMLETLLDGMSALSFSAEQALPDDEKPKGGGATQGALVATLALAVALGFGVFAVLPHALTWALGWLLGSDALEGGRALPFHLVDGVFKLLIFLGYVWGISKMKEMRRVFEYHGAEHQAVHAFEQTESSVRRLALQTWASRFSESHFRIRMAEALGLAAGQPYLLPRAGIGVGG